MEIDISRLEGQVILYCKNHYAEHSPKEMTNVEGLQRIWATACGHPTIYDSSLEYIAKRLSAICLKINPNRSVDWLLDQIHSQIGTTFSLKDLIGIYFHIIGFSVVVDTDGKVLFTLPKKSIKQ